MAAAFLVVPVLGLAAPVVIGDHSFETNAGGDLGAGGWSNDLGPEWDESGGPDHPGGFEERITGFAAHGTDHLGMAPGHRVWQDLGVVYEANTVYTLTVAVGHRGGMTSQGNSSTYAFEGGGGGVWATESFDAYANVAPGAFADAPALIFDTTGNPAAVGQTVRIALSAEGAGRSHFDNIRLDAVTAVPPGTATVENRPPTAVTATGAELRGEITDIGDGAPGVTIFYGLEDGAIDAGAWDASVALAGTQRGAFSSPVSGLAPATVYFFTARATNVTGQSWAAPSMSFETGPAAPSVENLAAADIGATVATLGADVTDSGGDLPDVVLYYGPSDGGTDPAAWASSWPLGEFAGQRTASVGGLAQNTTYYHRAFASNDGGSAWAPASASFATAFVTAPVVVNDGATSVTGTGATLRGEVVETGGDPPVVTLYYGPSDGGTVPGAWANAVSLGVRTGGFSQSVSGLSPETAYFFRCHAANAGGGAWAPESASFETTELVPETVVINELHYNPADNTSEEEFVELHNPGDSAVDLSGWRLNRGVDFTFPPGTSIPAHGFLVVGENPGVLQAVFGVAALGPYSGGLSGSGEEVELEDGSGARVDLVDYGTGFPWPTASDGGGSSMELVNPGLDNDLGGSWRASGIVAVPPTPQVLVEAGDDGWRYRRTTSEASAPVDAWRQIGFVEDGTWETGTASIGFGDNDDATVLQGMQGVHWGLYLRRPFTVDPLEIPAQLALRIYVDDGCIVWLNGVEIGRFHVTAGEKSFDDGAANHEAEWEELLVPNAGATLGGGTNVLAIHAMNSSLFSSDFSIDAELRTPEPGASGGVPTPGSPNSVVAPQAPPQIRQVDHTPREPASGVPVAVTAKITDPDGVGPVTLSYQTVDPGGYIRKSDPAYEAGWTGVPMVDDGSGGDLFAGDSVFTATLPAALHVHRRLVRYRIAFEDALGNAETVPYEDDGSPNFAYFVYDGVPAWTGASQPGVTAPVTFPVALMDDVPVYHLIADSTDVTNSQYNSGSDGVHMLGTLVYDGVVYDHIEFENRGEASTYQSGKNKWRFHFNRARDFEARDQWGSKYESPWDEMNFDSCASPWAPVNRGMAGLDEAISYRLYGLAGVPSPRLHYVHFRVVDATSEAPADQYAGDLWGLYTAIEQPDGSFLDDRGLPDGNVYKIEGGGGDKKHQAAGQPTTSSDWGVFAGASGSTQDEAYWRNNFNLEAYYAFRACNRILGNVDLRESHNHYFYHRPDGRWTVMPWDLDMMFIAETHWSGTIRQQACLNIPVIRTEFRNRCRELLDLVCSDPAEDGGQIGQLLDEYADVVNPPGQELTWADLDAFMWNYHPRTRGSPGNASGQGNHRGNFFAPSFLDTRIGGSWTRTLSTPDHEGFVEFLRDYTTDTFGGGAWAPGNGQQDGYGFEYINREAEDPAIPSRPTATHTGTTFATDDLTFSSTAFADPQGAGTFGAMEWRIAEIANPSTPGFGPSEPRKYEVETVWKSDEIAPFAAEVSVPAAVVRVGHTYRLRVRHRDGTGRWSHWSEPVQFVAAEPALAPWIDNLMVTELMYHPADPTPAEAGAGFADPNDFEFAELRNVSTSLTLDLTELRFTKGIDFDFVGGAVTELAPGGYVLVVRNAEAFGMRYGPGLPVAGTYSPDNLSNGGEQVKLSFGAGSAVRDFVYDDAPPWPVAADGGGFSLTLIDPASRPPHGEASSWRPSAFFGGSPGTSDAALLASAPDADDDGDGLIALLEHAFGTSDSDPASGAGAVSAAVEVIEVGGVADPYHTLTFRRNLQADDVSFGAESSPDLSQWGDDGTVVVSETPLGDGTATVVLRLADPVGESGPRRYLRLRVTLGVSSP